MHQTQDGKNVDCPIADGQIKPAGTAVVLLKPWEQHAQGNNTITEVIFSTAELLATYQLSVRRNAILHVCLPISEVPLYAQIAKGK